MQPFQRTAAVFDIDDSLLDGNAGTIFTWYLYSNREMASQVRSQVPRALYEYARKRLSEADMVALGSRCQQGIRTVRRHLLMGHLILVASGSPQFIIDELGRFLHSHEAVGTRAVIRNGVSTDELVPPIVFREGKRERVKEILARHGIDVGRCYLYSDSVADTPLFEEVGHPVVVNPKPAFRAEALRRGWEVVEWKGRWKTETAEDALSEEWLSWEG